MQIAIPALFMRGGTSRGPFFLESDLPKDTAVRNRVLLAALGSPHPLQVDGLGGGHSLTSKVGIIRKGTEPGIDVEFLFAQLQPENDTVNTRPNCGNMLAAVVPFAIERGLIEPKDDKTTACVLTRNTGMQSVITVSTPMTPQGRVVSYEGDARIDGVPGSSAPVLINFRDTAGSICSGLLPTDHVVDSLHVTPIAGPGFEAFDIDVTCIDNGMPAVIFRAVDVGGTGYETPAELNNDAMLKARVEAMRLHAGKLMGLGDVRRYNYPKMVLVSAPRDHGTINTRCFIPHVCHETVGVLAAVTIGTACVLDGSVAHGVARLPAQDGSKTLSIEHPNGEFGVELELDPNNQRNVLRAALLRTARLIMRGEVMIPRAALS